MKSNGKSLPSALFGSKKAVLIIFLSGFAESFSLRYDKVKYLNEDRWQMSRHDPVARAVTDKSLISD